MDKELLKENFRKHFQYGDEKLEYFFAPGRINLIGEHIDYNGGYVFPAALTIGIYSAVRRREDSTVRLISSKATNTVEFTISKELKYDEKDGWGNYPKGMVKYLTGEGYTLKGCDVYFETTLPDASGLSSSAALEVLMGYIMLYPLLGDNVDRVWLSVIAQRMENEFIKVNCGIMDQFSVAAGKKDNAILLDCSTIDYQYVPFSLGDYSLIIMNTNKKRGLADSKYNERRSQCDEALKLIKMHKDISVLCQATLEDVESYISDPVIKKRARHAVAENKRVLKAVEVLKEGNIVEFGKLLNSSHASLRDDYEVTGLELDTMQHEALKAEGCQGARMTGAGFGGCAIAIVENKHVESFMLHVGEGYEKATGIKPSFYISEIGDGVSHI
jgi:galactokinase